MAEQHKARAVGFNHVALEVGDIEEALAFYGRLFEFKLRSKSKTAAFIDLGDQFIALQKGRTQGPDDGRHFGLVVDNKEAVRAALAEAGVAILPGPFLDFLDPWGNRVEIVSYACCAEWGLPICLRMKARRRNWPLKAWLLNEEHQSSRSSAFVQQLIAAEFILDVGEGGRRSDDKDGVGVLIPNFEMARLH